MNKFTVISNSGISMNDEAIHRHVSEQLRTPGDASNHVETQRMDPRGIGIFVGSYSLFPNDNVYGRSVSESRHPNHSDIDIILDCFNEIMDCLLFYFYLMYSLFYWSTYWYILLTYYFSREIQCTDNLFIYLLYLFY